MFKSNKEVIQLNFFILVVVVVVVVVVVCLMSTLSPMMGTFNHSS